MRASSVIACYIVACLTACSGIQSSSVTEKGVKLNNYRTYAWIVPEDAEAEARADDRTYAKYIQQQADAALLKKGMVLDTEHPDAVFSFDAHVEQRVKYSQSPTVSVGFGFGGPGYYGGFGAPVAGGQVTPHDYEQGILTIRMFDTSTKKVIWTGTAQKQLTAYSDIEEDIRKAVRDIFIRLHVRPKK